MVGHTIPVELVNNCDGSTGNWRIQPADSHNDDVNTFKTTLRSSTDEDLLCVPGICLGFHPTESCVVLGIAENHVEFCARADLDWLDEGMSDLIRQVDAAAQSVKSCSFVILGYTQNPEESCEPLVRLALALREEVTDVLVATSDRYWFVTPLGLEPADGFGWDPSATSLTAEAVYLGIPIAATRAEAVAEVRPLEAPDEVEFLTESAVAYIAELNDGQRKELMEELLYCGEPLLPIEGAQLAVLVSDPEFAGDLVANLDREGAAKLRPRIAYARRMCSDSHAAEVLALLSLVCWFDNQGAQQTECLEQLESLAPQHRLLPLLRGLKALAVRPPSSFPPA
jgi:hypothetical protein